MEQHSKIQDTHLKRKAILYIRQSTMRQVYENTESTLRQYALRDKLVRLGWNEQMIGVIDCDPGQSGADLTHRSLQPKQKTVIEIVRIIDTVIIN